ncbi:phosphate transport system permease protein [Ferrimonas sediminum]|uniref:Phosphate transport system permease protein n=1 Tax=Ferrimonas sediminum TaxID=718193 RepID=A0A1G8QFD1_9GAMM|nr:ABC transporter permease subunit [Ferrimonas sediminum]SDJ03417.1 phosphate transport system permease protein [Ferrimonas sediminum]
MEQTIADKYRASHRRLIKDRLARYGVTAGGIMVLIALLLIFFYLLYVVAPVFKGASLTPGFTTTLTGTESTVQLGTDEQREYLYRITSSGDVQFFSLTSNNMDSTLSIPMAPGIRVTGFSRSNPSERSAALALDDGSVWVVQPDFAISYPNDVRTVTPQLRYPLGPEALQLSDGEAIDQLVFAASAEGSTFIWSDSDSNDLVLTRMSAEVDFLTDEVEWARNDYPLPSSSEPIKKLLLTPDQARLFILAGNRVTVLNVEEGDSPHIEQVLEAAESGAVISDIELLAGASSLMVANDNGVISQWFQVASKEGRRFERIREFSSGGDTRSLASEFFRKSFVAGTADGQMRLFYTTSENMLLSESFGDTPVTLMAFSPRGNGLAIQSGNQLRFASLDNAHPEVSWSALWQKVWYEGYPEPAYVWQSTSGSDDFEAKLSLMPLAFGTLKAALYAMLFATPLALAGAVYTAYFMSGRVRSIVKPTIEIMEALPTVILGFLAGLWLAPLVEDNLPGIFMLMLSLPLSVLLAALLWNCLPRNLQSSRWGELRELMLVPFLLLVGWGAMSLSPAVETIFMDGDARRFVTNELGITFDQRNALVVGIAMGFAVIPTIFSIAEDAVFSVPRHLVNGSLALGATTWQTLTRVVMLTASPGIFSAVMMGVGRAVGETMIVLMATGNTPLMEWNLFEGMRTLSANIAVEMPESAIGSSHYRVLFLTAFVLFIFTFMFNTLAEFVRQRLRDKYSTL